MKNVFLFCTKLWVYLTEVPVLILLSIALRYNEGSKELFKLYPLIIFLSLAVIFIAVYFFRAITVSREEIRYHGLFSSRDSALITKNKTLRVTVLAKGGLRLELYGDAGETPAFEWMRQEDVIHREICFFRGRSLGRAGTVSKISALFGVPEDLDPTAEGFTYEDENISVLTEKKDAGTVVAIKFKTTLL